MEGRKGSENEEWIRDEMALVLMDGKSGGNLESELSCVSMVLFASTTNGSCSTLAA